MHVGCLEKGKTYGTKIFSLVSQTNAIASFECYFSGDTTCKTVVAQVL